MAFCSIPFFLKKNGKVLNRVNNNFLSRSLDSKGVDGDTEDVHLESCFKVLTKPWINTGSLYCALYFTCFDMFKDPPFTDPICYLSGPHMFHWYLGAENQWPNWITSLAFIHATGIFFSSFGIIFKIVKFQHVISVWSSQKEEKRKGH